MSSGTPLDLRKELRRCCSACVPAAAWLSSRRDGLARVLDQCRSIADFLNKTTESSPTRNAGSETSSRAYPATRAMAFVRALRHDRAHGDDVKFETARQLVAEFKALSPDQQRQYIIAAAVRVGGACDFPSLEPMVKGFLGH